MKALVTSGATREPLDSVRFISNLSSGRTGAAICDALAARGFEVTQLHGAGSAQSAAAAGEPFSDHASLDAALRRLLQGGDYQVVVHAAAVSDYAPASPARGAKLAADRERILKLRPLPKIIDRIRDYAGHAELTLVGFKLTHEAFEAARVRAARELLRRSRADYVVRNDVGTLAQDEEHAFVIHARDGAVAAQCRGREALADALARLLSPPPDGVTP